MTAYLYLADDGYMAFESEQTFLKFLVSKRLTAINAIKEYDNGYVVIDTNYGEDYIDLNAIADEIGLPINFDSIYPILRGV